MYAILNLAVSVTMHQRARHFYYAVVRYMRSSLQWFQISMPSWNLSALNSLTGKERLAVNTDTNADPSDIWIVGDTWTRYHQKDGDTMSSESVSGKRSGW